MEQNLSTDSDLVAKALAGDRDAFACLYDRYARLVRAVVYGVAMDWCPVAAKRNKKTPVKTGI